MSLEKSFEMQRRAIEEFAGKMERNERARVEAVSIEEHMNGLMPPIPRA